MRAALLPVLTSLAGCALPNDDIARLRLEPPAIELEVDLERLPPPTTTVRVYAQRFDGLEYETSATIAFPAGAPPIGAFDGQSFLAANRGGFATALVTTLEGEVSLDVRVDLVALQRTNLDETFDPYFESATPIALPSTLEPGDDTIVPRDLSIVPFRVETPPNRFLPFDLVITAPFLALRYTGYTTGSFDQIVLPRTWARALGETVAGGAFDVRFRQLAQDLETVTVQRTTVRVADRSLGRTAIVALDSPGFPGIWSYDLVSGFGGVFGGGTSIFCELCELEHEPALGRFTVNSPGGFSAVIADIATQQVLATTPALWSSSAFAASGARLVTAYEGTLVMRDGFTALPLVTLDVGGFARDPAVSPDSKHLAWIDLAGDVWIADLDVVAATIANQRVLARGGSDRTRNPQFSPDGAWLLYAHGLAALTAPPFLAGAGFSIVPVAGGTPWRVSDAITDLDAGWTTPLGMVTAGGEAHRVTWLAYTRRAREGFSGIYLLPLDPVARTTLPAVPILDFVGSARHPPIFDRRAIDLGFPE